MIETADPVTVFRGEVVYLYAFDVANEITTARVVEILSRKPFPFTIRVDHTLPRDVPVYQPLAIEPIEPAVCLDGIPLGILVRIYGVGVITVAFRVPFARDGLLELLSYHSPRVNAGESLDKLAVRICGDVCSSLRDFLVRPVPLTESEAYTAFCLTGIAGVEDVNQWLEEHRRLVAGLLAETAPDRLSDAQVNEVFRLRQSFEKTDLVVIDWDAALVVDLHGYVDDVLYALELANLQLEEFRAMDRALDRSLDGAYVHLDKRAFSMFGVSSRMLRSLRWFRLDLTKLADEVTHITRFFGDWYLARVYLAARERFYLEQWRTSVEQRLQQLDRLYSVVHGEINERRMLWLEIIIVVFFAIDLLGIFFWKK